MVLTNIALVVVNQKNTHQELNIVIKLGGQISHQQKPQDRNSTLFIVELH